MEETGGREIPLHFEPIEVRTEGDATTVLARLTGDFPGSPVDLNHTFTISRNGTALLEIRS